MEGEEEGEDRIGKERKIDRRKKVGKENEDDEEKRWELNRK